MSQTVNSDAPTVSCPADGCNYRGFRKSVAAHYSGSRDEKHDGGYGRAQALLDFQEVEDEPADSPN